MSDIIQVVPTVEKPKRTKVAIICSATHWTKAPFKLENEWEIWGLNEMYISNVPRADRWFELHNIEMPNPTVADHRERLAKFNIPIYMWQHYDDIPTSVPYPKDEMLAKFGNYFTNSISWMLALAIHEGFKEIGVWGVDMAVDSEYNVQKPSCEWLLGWAMGKEIEVTIPRESDLLYTGYLYGFEDEERDRTRAKLDARDKELAGRIADYERQAAELNRAINQLVGARDDNQHWRRQRT